MALLKKTLKEIPLLFTFRTGEGGEQSISMETYRRLNETAASSGLVDLELNRGEELVRKITGGGTPKRCPGHHFLPRF